MCKAKVEILASGLKEVPFFCFCRPRTAEEVFQVITVALYEHQVLSTEACRTIIVLLLLASSQSDPTHAGGDQLTALFLSLSQSQRPNEREQSM